MWTKIKAFCKRNIIRFRRFITDEDNASFVVPITAILMGFLFGSIIMLVTGRNPLDIFAALLRGTVGIDLSFIGTGKDIFNPRYIGEFLVSSMPIILTGLSVGFAFRTGLFNIGAEGQLMMGAFGAIMVGILFDLPAIIHLPLAVFAGALFGGLWGFVPGFLKAKFNVHEVVVTIMMNYVALYTANYLFKTLPGSDDVRTEPVHASASLASTFLENITNNSRLHWGFFIVIIAVIIFWLIIDKTTFGFELKSAGFNPHASKYAGMKVERNVILSMVIAGAFAGLAGVVLALGTFDYGRVLPGMEGYGFDGIAVALVGGTTAIGTVLAGLLFGGLNASQPLMQARGIPRDIASIIIASIVLFVAMQSGIKGFLKRLKVREDMTDDVEEEEEDK
jgi:simple sugar transport system permease protein